MVDVLMIGLLVVATLGFWQLALLCKTLLLP